MTRHRDEQRRQRGARLPLPVDDCTQAHDRGGRDDVLVHRRHRQRSDRALRGQRRQRAAGVHEVPVPGAQARREGRGGQPDARARARPVLGAEQRRERDVRDEDGRRVLRRAHRRRHRVPQRRAEGAARRGWRGPGVCARAHHRVRCVAPGARGRVLLGPRAGVGCDPRRHGALRADVRRGEVRRARLVHGDHPARERRRQRHRDREPRPRPRQRGSEGRGPHADPRPLGRPGRLRDGRVRDVVPGRHLDRRGERRRAVGDLRDPDRRAAGADGRRDGRSRGVERSRSCTRAAATSSTCCPTPRRCATRWSGSPCASTRTSSCRARCSWIRARSSSCSRPAPGTSSPVAAPRRRPSGAILFSPEIEGRASAKPAASGRSSPTSVDGSGPTGAPARLRRRERGARRDRARRTRRTPGVEQLQKLGDAVQWGGTQLCADGEFPTPDGKAKFSAVAPAWRGRTAGRFVLSTRRGKQFNSMVYAEVDPLTGAARDALFLGAKDAEALGVKEGAAVLVRSEHGELHARVHLAPIRPGNVQVFFPEGNVLAAAGPAGPGIRCPRLQRDRRDPPEIADPPNSGTVCETPHHMRPELLFDLFDKAAVAIRDAVAPVLGSDRRARTDRPGQYAIDLVADRAALEILGRVAGHRGERGVRHHRHAGRIHHGRHRPDRRLEQCGATSRTGRRRSARSTARARSRRSSSTTRPARRSGRCAAAVRRETVIRSCRRPRRGSRTRSSGSRTFPGGCSRGSSSVRSARVRSRSATSRTARSTATSTPAACTRLGTTSVVFSICTEAGVKVIDTEDRPLAIADPNARRRLVAAGTPQLLQALRAAAG